MGLVFIVAIEFDWQHAGGVDHGYAVPAIAVGAAWLATRLVSRLKS